MQFSSFGHSVRLYIECPKLYIFCKVRSDFTKRGAKLTLLPMRFPGLWYVRGILETKGEALLCYMLKIFTNPMKREK